MFNRDFLSNSFCTFTAIHKEPLIPNTLMGDLILYVRIIISFLNATRCDLRGKNFSLLVIQLARGMTGRS